MNEHLLIPEEIQLLLDSIENIPTYLAELPLPDHPKLPQFNRKIRVTGIEAKAVNEFVYFTYEQVLYDKITEEQFKIPLPAPEWVVYKDTWSYLRNEANQAIETPTQEGSLTANDFVKVPSYKYMLYLMKNNKAGLLQLIEGYLVSFIATKIDELNANV